MPVKFMLVSLEFNIGTTIAVQLLGAYVNLIITKCLCLAGSINCKSVEAVYCSNQ
jgi:hypothetical protein